MQLTHVDENGITLHLFPMEATTIADILRDAAYQDAERMHTLRLLAAALDAGALAGEKAEQLAESELRLKASRGVVADAAARFHLSAHAEGELENLARIWYLEEQSERAKARDWKAFQGAHPTAERAHAHYRAVWMEVTGETSEEASHLLTPGQVTLLWEHGEPQAA